MTQVGASEAKTHLSSLLERVERGEEITITRHGKAASRLVPVNTIGPDRLETAVTRLKAFRKGRRLGDLPAKALIEEARR
ncbi:MAG TPA: type II toxin-antitoxin system prevent-host-death family antitoxin [Geminicoccaceae bacterium]